MAQSITDLKVGRIVMFNDEPCVITTNSFMRTAQRKPVMRTKLRSIISGKVFEKTFVSGEDFELVNIEKSNAQFMYKDAEFAYFMDNASFDQFQLSIADIEDALKYLKEGVDTIVTKFEGRPIGIELPPKVALKVIETTPGVKGDTASGGGKPATLETGITVTVPLFIQEGESVRINTETGEYVERAN